MQLRGVQDDAQVCVELESQALASIGEGAFRLSNGPYMRRFLDGFYPLRLSVVIEYPPALLQPADIEPSPQPGFLVDRSPGRIELDALFEGMLHTRVDFCLVRDADCTRSDDR